MVCACGQVQIASICLHAVSSAILMASLWLLWLLRNVVYYGMLRESTISTMICYYGIIECSIRDTWPLILLLWRISNDKKYVKVTNNFFQCSSDWVIVSGTAIGGSLYQQFSHVHIYQVIRLFGKIARSKSNHHPCGAVAISIYADHTTELHDQQFTGTGKKTN